MVNIHQQILYGLTLKNNVVCLNFENMVDDVLLKKKFIKWISHYIKTNSQLMDFERCLANGFRDSNCIIVYGENNGNILIGSKKIRPHIYSYKIWCNPIIDHEKNYVVTNFCNGSIQICSTRNKAIYCTSICINPYHYDFHQTINGHMVRENPDIYNLIITFPISYLNILKSISNLDIQSIFGDNIKIHEYVINRIRYYKQYVNVNKTGNHIEVDKKPMDQIPVKEKKNFSTTLYGFNYTQQLIKQHLNANYCREHFNDCKKCKNHLYATLENINSQCWYRIYFYIYDQKMGTHLEIKKPSLCIDGYTSLSKSNGVSLWSIIDENCPDKTKRCVSHFGDGIVLELESKNIVLTNRSLYSVFVHSENYNRKKNLPIYYVCRINSNEPTHIYDFSYGEKILNDSRMDGYGDFCSLIANCVIKVSLVKGWGENYNLNIDQTPIWAEIQIVPLLELLKIKYDAFLQQI